jgi:hypothetical protein
VKNSRSAILCLCLLSFLFVAPGRAQQDDAQTRPAPSAAPQQPAQPEQPETPAPAQRAGMPAPPPMPKLPDVRMPGETGYYLGVIGWMPFGTPYVDKGKAANFTGASHFHLAGRPSVTPSGEIGVAVGLHNFLTLSYFTAKAGGSTTAPGPLVLFSQAYTKGDRMATTDKLQTVKFSFDYLTWPYPVGNRKIRLRTLWQAHFVSMKSTYDAPTRSATADSNGILNSYATNGSKSIFTPALGLGLTGYASRNFRVEISAAGFAMPHRFALGDGEAAAAYRIGRLEIRVGGKGMFIKTSPKADYYFRGTMAGAFIGVRWCADQF